MSAPHDEIPRDALSGTGTREDHAAAAKTAKTPEERRRAVDILARTLYGEARGEPLVGKEAIAAVVLNRVARSAARGGYWWGNTIAEVCQKPWQFSCWNANDPNRQKILAVQAGNRFFDTCLRIARRAEAGVLEDRTKGATHYHLNTLNPPWARGKAACAEIGHHLFYNDIE